MHAIHRMMTNICTQDLQKSKDFYTKLLDLKVNFDSDWFVHLIAENTKIEIGLIDRQSELVPEAYRQIPNGFYLTFVVNSADEVFEMAKNNDFEIVQPPQDTTYGQRRLLLKDPDGTLIDISSLIV